MHPVRTSGVMRWQMHGWQTWASVWATGRGFCSGRWHRCCAHREEAGVGHASRPAACAWAWWGECGGATQARECGWVEGGSHKAFQRCHPGHAYAAGMQPLSSTAVRAERPTPGDEYKHSHANLRWQHLDWQEHVNTACEPGGPPRFTASHVPYCPLACTGRCVLQHLRGPRPAARTAWQLPRADQCTVFRPMSCLRGRWRRKAAHMCVVVRSGPAACAGW